MKKVILSLILAVLILPLAVAAPAYAAASLDGKVVIGENFILKSGETIQGDLVVINGSATVEAGARVTGNVVVMGGSADIAGRVDQNLTIMGGNVTLRSAAEVDGQLAVMGGSITREEGSQIKGGESQGFGSSGNWNFSGPRVSPLGGLNPLIGVVENLIQAIVMIGVLSLLALVITALWPEQTTRVSGAIATAPAVSGLLGLLTLIAVPIVLALIAITICLAPLSLLGIVVYMAALLFGWVAFGLLLGGRLAAAFRWNLPPAGAAALGTFITTTPIAILGVFGPLVCVSFALVTILACLGLGGVVLTRFGTTLYLSGTTFMAPPIPPTPPAPAAPYVADDLNMSSPMPMAEPPVVPEPPVEPPAA